ncbi:hypothetical protein E4U02_06135 [Microbacterium paludicola]|uniref:Uncharacterized protein n=1 Tax=Microbacterium paludicola TaxID=300019 RepID=A0A4Y9FWC5_9MICO|nr:hypothetical protein [Microbacterium paludicola]MBF0815982.1 hypothetical protein [Microbacterium paludicola]TFU33305.1 hypothetical protein E4U02_06135 [Microbacterium paludicola]
MVEPGPARRGRTPADPTRMRNQPALHTPKRWIWLVPGLLLAVVAIVAFALALPSNWALAWIGIAFVVASSVGLITAALTIQVDRTRNLTMAGLMAIMAAMSLILLLAILWQTQLPNV